MALDHSVALRPNPLEKDKSVKACAMTQVNGELSLKQLSRRVSMQTVVSRADVVAILISTVENLLDALQERKQVDFGDLGKSRLQVLNGGAESLKKFTSANIIDVNTRYISGEDLENIFVELEFQSAASRKAQQTVLRAEKAGETSVDTSKEPASGGSDSESPDGIQRVAFGLHPISMSLLARPRGNQKIKAGTDGLLRDPRSLSYPNSLYSNRDVLDARYGLSTSRPPVKAVQRKAPLSSYISRDIIIHHSSSTINY